MTWSRSLSLEVPESAIMHSSSKQVVAIDTLRHDGLRIAIDDFGTGFTNLGYLKTLPVDAVTIDQSFVRNIEAMPAMQPSWAASSPWPANCALESWPRESKLRAQAERLGAMGCMYGQGYYFSKPIPAQSCHTLQKAAVGSAPY